MTIRSRGRLVLALVLLGGAGLSDVRATCAAAGTVFTSNYFDAPIGQDPSATRGAFWALGHFDPASPAGVDNGTWPSADWLRYSPGAGFYVAGDWSASFLIDGCIQNAPVPQPAKMAVAWTTSDASDSYFVGLCAVENSFGDFLEMVNIPSNVMTRVPRPVILDLHQECTTVYLSLVNEPLTTGVYNTSGCNLAVTGYKVYRQTVQRNAPAPAATRNSSVGWTLLGSAAIGQPLSTTVTCDAEVDVYLMTTLVLNGNVELQYGSRNSVRIQCGLLSENDPDFCFGHCPPGTCSPTTHLCVYAPCNDDNPCTADSCAGNGCVFAPVSDGASCGANACAVGGDVCQSGICAAPVTLASLAGSGAPAGSSPRALVAGDFDRDGRLDLAVANQASANVTILIGDGAGGFTQPGGPFAAGAAPASIVAGDWNQDEALDLAVANESGPSQVTLLLNDGTGIFTSATVAAGTNPRALVSGDWNADGKPDLAVANAGSNDVTILLGDGLGGFAATAGSPVTLSASPQALAAGDWSTDGKADLAVANGNLVTILAGNGSGGFSPAQGSASSPTSPVALAGGDWNADGILDLALANASSDDLRILLGSGTGSFQVASGSPLPAGTTPFSIAAGDLNGDGKIDLAVANRDAASFNARIFLGNGAGRFAPATFGPSTVGTNPFAVALADLNRDGKLDLATANSGSNDVTVLLNRTPSAPDGTACDDGIACTTGDACEHGACIGLPTGPACGECRPAPQGLIGWWPAEGLANDISPSANHGTPVNSAQFSTAKVGRGFALTPADAGVFLPRGPALEVGAGDFTIVSWIRTGRSYAAEIGAIFDCASSGPDFRLFVDQSNRAAIFLRDASGQVLTVSGTTAVNDNLWHLVAAQRSGPTARVFVDGVEQAAQANALLGAVSMPSCPAYCKIGGTFTGAFVCTSTSTVESNFRSSIDELQIYGRALTTQEIQAIYDLGSEAQCRCTDADGDGYGQGGASCPFGIAPDCDDADAAAWTPPGEVQHLRLSGAAPTTVLTWTDQAPSFGAGISYDLIRGASFASLPVGVASESCVGSPWPGPSATDAALPSDGTGFWYLVRGRNACGLGTYGNQGVRGVTIAQRVSTTCP